MLEKKTAVDKIEIVNADTIPMIQVRNATWIEEDGVMIGSKGYSRYVLAPDADLANEPAQVVAIATPLFTQEVKDAYAAKMAEQLAETPVEE
jgi:DNA-binding protein